MKNNTVAVKEVGNLSMPMRLALIFAFAAATALAAQIRVPVPGSLVPMTMQTAVVLMAGLYLGRRDGAFSQIIYLACGALGLPFFASAMPLGAMALLGPTGGYLIGFVGGAWLAGHLSGKAFVRRWLAAFLGSLVILALGMIQLKFVTAVSWTQAAMTGLVPFLVGDVVKVTLSAVGDKLLPKQSA